MPQSTNPDTYTPGGWSDACDASSVDPKFAAGLEIRAATILNADVRAVAPADDVSTGMSEAVEVCNRVMGWDGMPGMLERGWSQVFGELFVTADRKGASLGEEAWEVADGLRVLADIEQRHLANLESWHRDDRGRVLGAHMRKSRTGRAQYTLPLYAAADELGGGVHFTFALDGDPEGRLAAILGPVIDWDALKRHMTAQAYDGVSRWAMPVVNAVLRAEVAQRMGLDLDSETILDLVTRAQSAAVAFMSGEESALASSDIIGLEPFGGVLDLSQWVELCNMVDHQGLTVIGTPNLTMGVSAAHGSRSAAETIDDLLLRSLAARLTMFLAQLRRQSVRRLVRYNLGPKAPVPLLVHEGIDVDGLGIHMGSLPHLAAAGFVNPNDPADLRQVRRTIGLPSRRRPIPAPAAGGPLPLGDPGAPGPGRGNEADPNLTPLEGA